ncbi:unnamed protein product [Rotaria magnacalcarata]|uniref:Peptidase M14 domain-containing protein n=2 Tax=Rotaria magnacalcarata TaxID=392030 RepID=A0A816L7F4_9BILA|nr:unnamed protein product [Rotaria magnacalcarata]
MRIGQSIWSREDFNLNNPSSSLLLSAKSNTLLKLRSNNELNRSFNKNNDETEEENSSSNGNIINSSKNLFVNLQLRSRIYEEHELATINGTIKKIYSFRSTKISIDDSGPFWPMAFPMKHPTPSFLPFTRNQKNNRSKEYYHSQDSHFLGNNLQQTFDNQPAMLKYTDVIKHSILVYDMDKSPRQQIPKLHENEQMCPPLIFESRFEGGNLRQVKRVGQFEYELILRPDLYTRRHTQWYYFRVQNMIANITYRFRIINLVKKTSLYNEGMQILLFSDVAGKKELRGWHRAGHHINYAEYKQRTYNPLLERDINYYELDFQLEFTHSGDTCYIAHCYPYTFTDLKDDLDYLASIRPRDVFQRDILCESQAGNSCFIITVTDESVPISEKKFVFITARIHPGETNSSYMMRGVLEFITSDDKIAQKLRSQLVFKIVPMLNPDGVIIGNYRCSLTGKDMNRNFRHPRKQTFPTIYHVKELMQSLQKEQHEIIAFCDLHGHSRKSNVFAYGCDGCDGPQPDMKNFLSARILPFLMSRTAPEMFAFDFCKFHIHRCKESTGRVVMWKEMLIKNSFTLEASFAGSSILAKPRHFNIQDYEKFGQCICQSLRQYLDILSDSTRLDSIFLDITKNVLRKLGKDKVPPALLPIVYPEEKQNNESPISIMSVASCLQVLSQCHETINAQDVSSSSDSDSDPEGGELPDIPYRKEEPSTKKKLKKKRPEKIIEERVQKLARKRETNEESNGISGTNGTNGTDGTNGTNEINRRIRVSYPFTSEIDMNSQLKLTLAVDQMDKATRALPPRGTLFTSKYANRSGHGLPIFTTERALERKQKRSHSGLQESHLEHQSSDNDSDNDAGEHSQIDTSTIIDPNASITTLNNTMSKRTASFVSLTLNDLPSISNDQSIPTISSIISAQAPMFKNLPQRRLQQMHRRHHHQQQQNKSTHGSESDRMPMLSPSTIAVPNLMELANRSSPSHLIVSSSMNLNDIPMIDSSNKYSYETITDSNGVNHHRLYTIADNLLRPFSKIETAAVRSTSGMCTKMPPLSNSNNNNNNLKRSISQKSSNHLTQQPLATIESVLRERSIIIANENTHQPDAMERVNHILKQLYLPLDKTKKA